MFSAAPFYFEVIFMLAGALKYSRKNVPEKFTKGLLRQSLHTKQKKKKKSEKISVVQPLFYTLSLGNLNVVIHLATGDDWYVLKAPLLKAYN